MSTSYEDKGHRIGNFHNYYSFNPCRNRLDVLRDCGILRYLRDKYAVVSDSTVTASTSTSTSTSTSAALDDGGSDHDDNGSGGEGVRVKDDGSDRRKLKRARVCDGTKSNSNSVTVTTSPTKLTSKDDGGTGSGTDGNIDTRTFTYCDLGCNEGDLSLALSNHLLVGNTTDNTSTTVGETEAPRPIRCLGLDIDPRLIDRANNKIPQRTNTDRDDTKGDSAQTATTTTPARSLRALFRVCNLCNANDHKTACGTFLTNDNTSNDGPIDGAALGKKGRQRRRQLDLTTISSTDGPIDGGALGKRGRERRRFDLTTIFSTTMWIHIHAGDGGLVEFLERACGMTDLLVVEPQPSKWYVLERGVVADVT